MIARRSVLKAGVIAPLLMPQMAGAASLSPDAMVLDRRFGASVMALGGHLPCHEIDGDVTALWSLLDTRWRARGHVLAGVTGADALFVIEQLGFTRGRRVMSRVELMPRSATLPALVSWVIAPVHSSVKG